MASILQLFLLVLLARQTGPATFGQFSALVAIGALSTAVLSRGLPTLALRLNAIGPASQTSAPFMAASALNSVAVAALVAAAGILMSVPSAVIFAAAVTLSVETLAEAQQGVLGAYERQGRAAAYLIGRRMVAVGIATGLTLSGSPPVLAYTAGVALGIAFPASAMKLVGFRRLHMRELSVQARTYWPAAVMISVWPLDVLIASSLMGLSAGGIYAASTRLVSPLNIVIGGLLAVATPRLTTSTDQAQRLAMTRNLRFFAWMLALTIVVGAPILAWVATHLLGTPYDGAGSVIVFLCVATALSGVTQTYVAECLADGKPRRFTIATGCSVAVGLSVLAVLSIFVGLPWAALGAVACQSCLLILLANRRRSKS